MSPARRERLRISRLVELRAVASMARRMNSRALRILAYHGVDDPEIFSKSLDRLRGRYQPVSADQVLAGIDGDQELPRDAVWITFDDGLPSTFDTGPMLAQRGISATVFVCPVTFLSGQRLWFQTVDAAEETGIRGPGLTGHPSRKTLKEMPDRNRRQYVADLEDRLDAVGYPPPSLLNERRLREWTDLGHTIGNHTWDHPCLDTCSEDEQRAQIVRADAALTSLGTQTRLFAYPNGNHTDYSERVLRDLGYRAAVLFDHRLTRTTSNPLALSRLRIDSTATPERLDSILSGAHSDMFQARSRTAKWLPGGSS